MFMFAGVALILTLWLAARVTARVRRRRCTMPVEATVLQHDPDSESVHADGRIGFQLHGSWHEAVVSLHRNLTGDRLQAFVDPDKPTRAYVRGQPPTARGTVALALTAGLAWLMAWNAREAWQGRPIAWVEELIPKVDTGVQLLIGLLTLLAFLAVPVLGGVLLWHALSQRSTVAPRHAARLFVVGLVMLVGGIGLLVFVIAGG